jgi:ABC-type lipoprotein export system ATPase subunit
MANPITTITLNQVLPNAFRDRVSTTSDIWLTKNFEFKRGQLYSINAASGVGKSSLCTFIYGARRDYAGTISFDGRDVRSFKVNELCELRKSTLAWLPQELLLFPELTVIENIQLKNRLSDRFSDSEIREMLGQLSIDSFYNRRVGTLSVGQQQRVAAVRTLCQPFDFILLDEPVSHLDEVNNRALGKLVTRVAHANNAAVITTSVGYDLQLDATDVKRINL